MLRRRGLTKERLWLTKLYAGHRYVVAMFKVTLKTQRAVDTLDGMPCETIEDRKARAEQFMRAMSA